MKRPLLGLALGFVIFAVLMYGIPRWVPDVSGGGAAALVAPVSTPPPSSAEVETAYSLLLIDDKEARRLRDAMATSCGIAPDDTVDMLCALRNKPINDELVPKRDECKKKHTVYTKLMNRWNAQPDLDPGFYRTEVNLDEANTISRATDKLLTCGDLEQL